MANILYTMKKQIKSLLFTYFRCNHFVLFPLLNLSEDDDKLSKLVQMQCLVLRQYHYTILQLNALVNLF